MPREGWWRCPHSAEVETFFDIAVMYALLIGLFLIAMALMVPRLAGP